MSRQRVWFAVLGLAILLAACRGQSAARSRTGFLPSAELAQFKTLIAEQSNPSANPQHVSLSADVRGAKVNPDDIEAGCAAQDCIPALIAPKFESAASANSWLNDLDVVFGISFSGIQRAYPQRILNWHEIVNDTIGRTPVVITFCPLCGSALAFHRTLDGRAVTFGVSGLLYNSDLIMYDRRDGSLWQQFTGRAIIGPAAQRNEGLQEIDVTTTTWGAWKRSYPRTQVLSQNTGYDRNYDQYPYGSYEQDNELYFGIQHTDQRLPLKTVVYGIEIGGKAKAYTADLLEKRRALADVVGGHRIALREERSGTIHLVDLKTGRTILPLRTFWFAWAAFHPDTELAGRTAFRPGPTLGICPGPSCRASRDRLLQGSR
jgi:hypothetical protein